MGKVIVLFATFMLGVYFSSEVVNVVNSNTAKYGLPEFSDTGCVFGIPDKGDDVKPPKVEVTSNENLTGTIKEPKEYPELNVTPSTVQVASLHYDIDVNKSARMACNPDFVKDEDACLRARIEKLGEVPAPKWEL